MNIKNRHKSNIDSLINNPVEMLSFIVKNYTKLEAEDPVLLADRISNFAKHLLHIGMREEFVKAWMEQAIKLDFQNKEARMFLIKQNLRANESFLDFLQFPAIRESDNRSQRGTTINQYKQICFEFLDKSDNKVLQLQKELSFIQSVGGSEFENSYSKLLSLLEKITEQITNFIELLNDYEETSSTTFYNTSFFKQIQKTVSEINELRDEWKNIFIKDKDDYAKIERKALQELKEMVGLTQVKKRIEDFYDYLKYQKQRKLAGFQSKDEQSLNMVLLGNPGTGKTTIARLLAQIYHELGVLPRKDVVETNRSQLIGSFVGQTEENVRMYVEKALGGVLFIDEAYSLKRDGQSGNDYGQTAIDTLVSLMTSKEYGGKFSVILAGYPEEMRQFLDSNPGLRSRFPASNVIELPDYSNDELLLIGEKIARDNDFLLTIEGKQELSFRIENERIDTSFGNARTVQNIISQAIFQKGAIQSKKIPDIISYSVLDKADFHTEKRGPELQQSPMDRLNELIGLKEIKDAVQMYISFVKMQTYRRDHQLPHVPIQLHSVFTGNPGTGKTTVAKIYAELLKEVGMLKRGHLVVVGRADLIAGYVGQSALKTKRKIREALGGVLFIDEAYSLFRNNNSDYGKEVIDTLVDEMTKHGDNLVVILAGYPNEMEQLLESNPGLKSRFKKFFHFPDYSSEELILIMRHYANKYAYMIEEEAIQFISQEIGNNPVKGNGRFAENIIHEAIQQQAMRLMNSQSQLNSDSVNSICKADIEAAYQTLKKGE